MQLKYTGPKEIISPHGVDFKDGKEDKYVYVAPAIEIFYAIHHDYEKNRVYTHSIEKEYLEDDNILSKILELNPKLEDKCKEEIEKLEKELDKEIEEVKEHIELVPEEQLAYKNNLIIMKSYRIQRQTNKIIYQHLIEIIVDEILKHRLKQISTPVNEKFWHILHSIQGELSNHNHRSIGSELVTSETEPVVLILKIDSIGK